MEKKLNILPILQEIVTEHTEIYQSDFLHDVDRLSAAMLDPVPENRVFLWMCRSCGTWLLGEREVYLRDTEAHNVWTHPDYIAQANQITAYRVTVFPGTPGPCIMGSLQRLNYGEQVERVKRLALPVQQVILAFKGGETHNVPFADYPIKRNELIRHIGPIENIHYQPENEGELSTLLYMERHPPKQRSRRPKKPTPR